MAHLPTIPQVRSPTVTAPRTAVTCRHERPRHPAPFFDLYYMNAEFDNYEISGRYGLPKVDKVIAEVEKIEGIDEKGWVKREMSSSIPLFENEAEEVSNIHILKNNRIVIVDENQKPIKEIKVKDYRKIDLTIYKGILYIYDDGKIYEYSLKNLNDVKVIEVKNL